MEEVADRILLIEMIKISKHHSVSPFDSRDHRGPQKQYWAGYCHGLPTTIVQPSTRLDPSNDVRRRWNWHKN